MERFNATVTTTVLNKNHVEVQDTVVFSGVDQGFVDFLTGSCKLAVLLAISFAEIRICQDLT